MGCDFNDMLWDFNAMLRDWYALLWEIEIKGINDMVCYAMFWYAMRFEQKRLHTQRRVPNISKLNDKKPMFSTNLQCLHLLFKKAFKSELKS